jgi:hypothetical protein
VGTPKPDANPIRLIISPVLPKGTRSLKFIRVLPFVKPAVGSQYYLSCPYRYIETMLENQELDSVTKLQLVQPLLFGDTILCYHRKIKQLILGRYCRYHNLLMLL